jgi:hypothetical protein
MVMDSWNCGTHGKRVAEKNLSIRGMGWETNGTPSPIITSRGITTNQKQCGFSQFGHELSI